LLAQEWFLALLEFTIEKRFPPGRSGPGFELDVRFSSDAGVTVLFGASGAGKTLTLEALAGFLRPDRGRILLNDEILFDAESGVCLPPQRRGVGYVFQNDALFPHMTLDENLAFGIARLPVLERHRRVRGMLEKFGLTPLASRRPQELSGGQKQRASIARALVTEPRLLLLDEPVRGLDYPLRQDFYEILREVRRTYRIPILLVTHDVREGFELGAQMAVYEAGRIVQTGAPEEIFLHPRSPSVARLFGITNVFSGTIEALDPAADTACIRTEAFPVTVPYLPGRLKGDKVSFCIPQEHVQLLSGGPDSERARENSLRAQVVEEILTPGTVRLHLEIAGAARSSNGTRAAAHLESELTRAAYKKLGVAKQKEWTVALPKAFIHVFGDSKGTGNRE
jgi:molybdate transport system ATP-binding protein